MTVAARHDLYGDAVNEAILMRPGIRTAELLRRFDDSVVSGSTRAVASAVAKASTQVRHSQTGYVRSYALTMLAGSALLIATMVAVMLW